MPEAPVMLVTGARKGLGRGLAERYLAQGWAVVGCSRGASDLEHPAYRHVQADVAEEGQVRDLLGAVREEHGRLDAVLNNAGVASMNHAVLTPSATAERVMRVNFLGTFQVTREAAKLLRRSARARVVNFVSVATPLRLEGEAAYAASKAAVLNLTEVLAKELAGWGVTVNAVGPCPVATDLVRGVPEAAMEALLARQAIPRYAELEEVAHVVDFFLAPEARMVTAQVVYLGGVPG